MTPAQAATAMREKADEIALARARMSTQMRAVARLAGKQGLRAMFEAEFEKIDPEGANDNSQWIG
ncbi:hypothetical protein [Phenylobacterium sp.]|uniref:hypothetical protein n=1 Tax=Phenylobacterium sp. TaxID=1871053 RepID=UPI0030021D27